MAARGHGGISMPKRVDRIELPAMSPGTRRRLTVQRYGTPGARPKAYLQAALHTDELPGLLVLHHLARLLDAMDDDRILGEIILVPYANPIGLGQAVPGAHPGRYELAGGGNFNRNWPDPAAGAIDRLSGRLGTNAAANVSQIRAALAAEMTAQKSVARPDELTALRFALIELALGSDIVLDLHCDSEALMHLYLGTELWPDAADLSALIGSRATMLATSSGGDPFDESFSAPWARIAERFPDHPVPTACLSATIELRGEADVDDRLAEADARSLLQFLRHRKLLAGDPGTLPAPLCEATPLDAVDVIRAPASGLLAYAVAPGDRVRKGDLIADVVDIETEDPAAARTPAHTETDGFMLSRRSHKLARAGEPIAKIVGTQPLDSRKGRLLED